MPHPQVDFFISYTQVDRAWAEWVAWRLEHVGYAVLLQAWDIRPGSNFILEMDQAIATAARTIAILTPEFLGASFTKPEWAAALAADPTGAHGKLVPVRVKDCEPQGLLRQIVYVDLVGLDDETATTRLLEGVAGERPKPSVSPRFPGGPAPPTYPGQLSQVWSVPHRRNPHFTGRGDVLQSLHTQLHAEGRTVVTQAISGLGGIGKTQVALEYAYRNALAYVLVWWVRAETEESRRADFRELAAALQVPIEPADGLTRRVVAALEQRSNWLIIFDNVEQPDDLRDCVPQNGQGHVLITSRFRFWPGVSASMPLDVWGVDEAADYLLARTRQSDREAAKSLSEKLGHLPLALEQAAAYIDESSVTIVKFADVFDRQKLKILTGQAHSDTRATVATLWDISFKKVQATDEGAVSLLTLCAFLQPDRIVKARLVERASVLPPSLRAVVTDDIAFDRAVAALRRYSLVDATSEFLSIHRLVQLVIRERLDNKKFRMYSEAAVRLQTDVADAVGDVTDDEHPLARIRPPVWMAMAAVVLLLAVTAIKTFDLKLPSAIVTPEQPPSNTPAKASTSPPPGSVAKPPPPTPPAPSPGLEWQLPVTVSREVIERIRKTPGVPFPKGFTNRAPAPGQSKTAIILHNAFAPDRDGLVDMLRRGGPDLKLPLAHWLVRSDGRIQPIAPEGERAAHLGRAGNGLTNGNTIGVETAGSPAFADMRQVENLVRLVSDVAHRWSIPTERILGHGEVAVPAGSKPDMLQQAPAIRAMVAQVRPAR
jgi:hypothetical protein